MRRGRPGLMAEAGSCPRSLVACCPGDADVAVIVLKPFSARLGPGAGLFIREA